MDGGKKNILITGLPGTGKTTLIVRLAGRLAALRPAGFFTEEIRERGARLGFAFQSFDGRKGVLSQVDFPGPHRVGKYGVDVAGFERFLDAVPFRAPESKLVVIDEIGKMECLSARFREIVAEILGAPEPLVATVALKGTGFIDRVKARSDVRLFVIDRENRDRLLEELVRLFD